MTTIQTPRLFRVRDDADLRLLWLTPAKPGDILWLHTSRRSSLGSYIGTFSPTYSYNYLNYKRTSPKEWIKFQINMSTVEPIPNGLSANQ